MKTSGGSKKKSLAASLVIVGLVVGYVLLRPIIQRQFGIQLPSITQEDQAGEPDARDTSETQQQADAPSETSPPPINAPKTDSGSGGATGQLRDVGRNVKQSAAGLRYGPGSFEGHRLKHVMKHAVDDPERPVHGVFDGRESEIVAVIDEAYQKGLKQGRGVKVQREDGRTIYTVDMRRRVGYIGGQKGKRRDHPPATGVRLVLEGANVITAFPVEP